MVASESMDLDPKPTETREETGCGVSEANDTPAGAELDSQQAAGLRSSPRLRQMQSPPRIGQKVRSGAGASRGSSQAPRTEAVARGEPIVGQASMRAANDASRSRAGSEPIIDEIVVATTRHDKKSPPNIPQPDLEEADDAAAIQPATITPTDLHPPEDKENDARMPRETTTTGARFVLKDEEDANPPSRRNPKRAAAVSAPRERADTPNRENILEAALAPVTEKELEDWEGWVELESEPAFFNFILRDLGAKDVQIREVLCLDDDLIRQIPKPIHGLIFLFQYLSDDWDVDEESETGEIWFANQTVDNACATIAMLNIIMNAPHVELGETLKSFKEDTRSLSSPLRGHALSTNKFIRKVHNSFTRRLDHLNADLWLSSKAEKPNKRTKRAPAKKSKRKKDDDEPGYHFIAYVPINGFVWELDGLKARPAKLEPVTSEDWALNALPKIWSRMEDYGGGFEFNLLAMCQSPLRDLCRDIAANARVLDLTERRLASLSVSTSPLPPPEPVATPRLPTPERFPEYWVTPAMVSEAPIPEKFRPLLSLVGALPTTPADESTAPAKPADDDGAGGGALSVPRDQFARALHEATGNEPPEPPPPASDGELVLQPADIQLHLRELASAVSAEQAGAVARHDAEIGSLWTDLERVEGRKKDYTPAIHAWVKILAEKGVLEQIAG